jgi:hypothetical protein
MTFNSEHYVQLVLMPFFHQLTESEVNVCTFHEGICCCFL